MYDAVVVCGMRLQDDNTFPPFVYQEIDRAIWLLSEGLAEWFVFCGNYWAGEADRGIRECDVAEAYLQERYPSFLSRFLKEGQSTVVQENWGFLKLTYPTLRRLHQVTITPLLPRMRYVAEWTYGDEAELSFTALPWPSVDFPLERTLLKIAKCIYASMERGDHTFLIRNGVSRWQELWKAHENCTECFG